jgi:palmitoyltransferase
VAVIALSGLFCLFAFGMTLTAGRYIFTNITNIDMLRRRQTFNLAVLIPRGTPPSPTYRTVVYPLQALQPGQMNGLANPISTRDDAAFRTFAILKTEPSENPWNLGLWENWKSVMGHNPLEWLLPIKGSPCCSHDSMHSDYPMGPLLDELKQRYGLPDSKENANGHGA